MVTALRPPGEATRAARVRRSMGGCTRVAEGEPVRVVSSGSVISIVGGAVSERGKSGGDLGVAVLSVVGGAASPADFGITVSCPAVETISMANGVSLEPVARRDQAPASAASFLTPRPCSYR